MRAELQKPWAFDGLQMPSADSLIVKLSTAAGAGYPNPIGRRGQEILAEPEIFIKTCRAEFQFTQCVVIRVWDDIAMLDSEGTFDGDTFRTYSESSLLAALEHQRAATALFHYRLYVNNSGMVIDVATRKAPRVSLQQLGSV